MNWQRSRRSASQRVVSGIGLRVSAPKAEANALERATDYGSRLWLRSDIVATISVVIPNYNRAALIGETIENSLRQTRPPDELIVVDDGSTDNFVRVIRNFGNRVVLIEQANKGPGAARNAGLASATGDFVQFFDSRRPFAP